jgi:hypothetical protein
MQSAKRSSILEPKGRDSVLRRKTWHINFHVASAQDIAHLPNQALVRAVPASQLSINANTLLFCPGRIVEFQDGY